MVLEFGLLKSGLFPESELTGEGLGGDGQQTVVSQKNLVGSAVLSAGTSVDFTGLTGTRYLMVFHGAGVVTGADHTVTVNNVGSGYDFRALKNGASSQTVNAASLEILNTAATSQPAPTSFWCLISLGDDGTNKFVTFLSAGGDESEQYQDGHGWQTAAQTSISSIKYVCTDANGVTGRLSLYELEV